MTLDIVFMVVFFYGRFFLVSLKLLCDSQAKSVRWNMKVSNRKGDVIDYNPFGSSNLQFNSAVKAVSGGGMSFSLEALQKEQESKLATKKSNNNPKS